MPSELTYVKCLPRWLAYEETFSKQQLIYVLGVYSFTIFSHTSSFFNVMRDGSSNFPPDDPQGLP